MREQRLKPSDFQAVYNQVSLSPDGRYSAILQSCTLKVAVTDSRVDSDSTYTYNLPFSLRSRCRARKLSWSPTSSNIFVIDGLGQDIFVFSTFVSGVSAGTGPKNSEIKLHLHAQDFLDGGKRNDESEKNACIQVIPFSFGNDNGSIFGVHLVFASGYVTSLRVDTDVGDVAPLSAKGLSNGPAAIDLAVHIAHAKSVILVGSDYGNNARQVTVKLMQYSVLELEVVWTLSCEVGISSSLLAITQEEENEWIYVEILWKDG